MTKHRDGGVKDALDLDQARAELAENAAPAADAEAEQLGLFSGSSVFGTIKIPEGGEIKRTGPGRPRGSLSRSTKDIVKLIERTGKNPIMAMAEIVATPIDVIARTLGCKKLEAAEYHRKVMSDLAPYVAQRLPLAIQLPGANAGMLVINPGGAAALAAVSGLDMRVIDVTPEREENQGLSDDDDGTSHGTPSHDGGK